MRNETPAAIKADAAYREYTAAREHVSACWAVVKADRKFWRKVRTTKNTTAIARARDDRREAILHSEVTATTWRMADDSLQYIAAKDDSQ